MNWRPKYDDEEDEDDSQSKPAPAASVIASANSRAHGGHSEKQNDGRTFHVSLSQECPPVQCLGSHAFACMQDGVACTVEQGSGVPSIGVPSKWTLHIHPSAAKLSHRHTAQLAQVIYCCLYAALAKSGEDAIRLKLLDPSTLGPSAQKALLSLGIPLDLSLPVTPSFLLQLYQHAEMHLLAPAFPFFAIQSFHGSRKPVAHPARPPPSQAPPELVYSRYDTSLSRHVQMYKQILARGAEWLTILPSAVGESGSGLDSNATPLQMQLSWALEDPAFEAVATEIQDYDRGQYDRRFTVSPHADMLLMVGIALHLEGAEDLTWAKVEPFLQCICHYAFLTESRSTRLWATCADEEQLKILSSRGWKPTASTEGSAHPVKVLYLAQKDFWNNIKFL